MRFKLTRNLLIVCLLVGGGILASQLLSPTNIHIVSHETIDCDFVTKVCSDSVSQALEIHWFWGQSTVHIPVWMNAQILAQLLYFMTASLAPIPILSLLLYDYTHSRRTAGSQANPTSKEE